MGITDRGSKAMPREQRFQMAAAAGIQSSALPTARLSSGCVLGALDQSATLQISRELWAKARVFLPHFITQGPPSPCTPSVWIYKRRPTATPVPVARPAFGGEPGFLALGPWKSWWYLVEKIEIPAVVITGSQAFHLYFQI